MKVLVVGGGGREHAMAWKIAQSPRVSAVCCAPGNAGIAGVAECVDIGASDVDKLAAFARDKGIDLTVVGPEQPLTLGIVDLFRERGLRIFGATRAAAEIEGSKVFAKHLMSRYGIPTAAAGDFSDLPSARRYLEKVGAPVVVKADGLAAGKGVVVCRTMDEARDALRRIMEDKVFGAAGNRVVIEEFLDGEEASFLAFTDGTHVLPMASSQDHKTVFDGDEGPNTGGMGAYSPAPVVTGELSERITKEVMLPAVRGMAHEGRPYCGVLYAGIMVTSDGPKVLEFNARFGDPETQPILMRMQSDLIPVLEACIDGRLEGESITWKEKASVCVVMSSPGYPGAYPTGAPITGLAEAEALGDVVVFHAGTRLDGGRVVTAGGRVLGVTALGSTVARAVEQAYRAASLIQFDGVHYRRDIGHRAVARESR